MNGNRRNQQGFTLIELVLVIVILGILAAVAIPRFINLAGNAQQAAVQGMAGGLGSASAINYSGCAAVNNVVTPGTCSQVASCSAVATLLTPALTLGAAGAPIANTYNLAADTAVATNGAEATCTLQYLRGGVSYTATYTATGAGN
jgi:prepilin-type N-terminal cleavage/methylation domain-containing protein